jgi:hypothetical protein
MAFFMGRAPIWFILTPVYGEMWLKTIKFSVVRVNGITLSGNDSTDTESEVPR